MRRCCTGYLFITLIALGVTGRASSAAPADDNSTLTGRVTLDGTPPAARQIKISKDPEICSAAGKDIQDVVVGENGGVADVVIEIQGIRAESGKEWKWKTPKDGYVLRQKNCSFEPKLLVIPSGAEVKVFNDDPVAHNVNTGQWNEMQASGGPAVVKPLSGRSPIKVGCNIHSWMEAWVYPARTPFFAVTDKKGGFRIENIPPGKYRVNAWHSNLGKQRETVTFEAGAAAVQDFTFKSE